LSGESRVFGFEVRTELDMNISGKATTQAAYIAAAPASCKTTLTKAFAGQGSPRNAIKAKCLTCCGYDRIEVRECRVVLCPLWHFRPFQNTEKLRNSANRGHCGTVATPNREDDHDDRTVQTVAESVPQLPR
jgi:hypothetical protein